MCLSGRKVVTIFQVQAKKLLRKKIVGSNIEQFKLTKVYPSYIEGTHLQSYLMLLEFRLYFLFLKNIV